MSSTGFQNSAAPQEKTTQMFKTSGSFFPGGGATRDAELSSRCGSRRGRAGGYQPQKPLITNEEWSNKRRPVTKGRFQEPREYFNDMEIPLNDRKPKNNKMKDTINLQTMSTNLSTQKCGEIRTEDEYYPSYLKSTLYTAKNSSPEGDSLDGFSLERKPRPRR